jgi:large subunit ribosomal protein L21
MYAIVDIAGQQFKVEKEQELFVNRLDADEGANIEFDKVLLIDDEGKVKVGKPNIKDAKVSAKIVNHVKGDKVLVFKKKRRKGYQKMNGFRSQLSKIQIEEITTA